MHYSALNMQKIGEGMDKRNFLGPLTSLLGKKKKNKILIIINFKTHILHQYVEIVWLVNKMNPCFESVWAPGKWNYKKLVAVMIIQNKECQ